MMKNVHFARPRRAFFRVNIALSICALSLASLTLASKTKQALAVGPDDGVCANVIGSANCPDGFSDWGYYGGIEYTACHSSSPYYNQFGGGPYYNCCEYDHRVRQCYDNANHALSYQDVEYFRLRTAGGRCLPDGTQRLGYANYHCTYDYTP